MYIHFYATMQGVNDIGKGLDTLVYTKDGAPIDHHLHISLNTDDYFIDHGKDIHGNDAFRIKKKTL